MRPKTKQEKQEQAKMRQEEYSILNPKQKILKLDLQLGKDIGARKQRTKLAYEIEHTGFIPDNVGSQVSLKDKKKPYQRSKRS